MIDETTGVPQLDLFDSLLRYARKTAWLPRRGSFSVAVPIAVRSRPRPFAGLHIAGLTI
jgi:hypothetical protein